MHYIQFNQIARDAEIANVISSVVREHRLTEGEIEKALLEHWTVRYLVADTGHWLTGRLVGEKSQSGANFGAHCL